MATSLIGLVGDYLFSDRMLKDSASAETLAVEVAALYQSEQMPALQQRLEDAGGELGGRLMVLDASGKVQADSYSELNGSRLELPEVAAILLNGESVDYGVHALDRASGEEQGRRITFLRPFDSGADWVGYCAAALTARGETIGVLLLSTPIQDMMQRLYALQDKMVLYFVIAALAAMVFALIFSRVITNPIASLTRGIQRMGRGDLSVRVPVKGSGEMRRLAQTFNAMSEKLELLDKSRNQFVSRSEGMQSVTRFSAKIDVLRRPHGACATVGTSAPRTVKRG